jgi:hypothetical protein
MGVDKHTNPLFFSRKKELSQVCQVGFIVKTGALVLYRFPGDKEPDKGKPPVGKLPKALIRLFQGEGPSYKGQFGRVLKGIRL